MTEDQQPTMQERSAAVRARFDELRDQIDMSDVTSALGDITTKIAGLPGEIAGLRERKYAFAGYLERKAEVLKTQWDEVRGKVQSTVRQEVERAQAQLGELDEMWQGMEKQWSDEGKAKVLSQIELAIESAEQAVAGAKERIKGLYGNVPDNVQQTQHQLGQIGGFLALAEASTADWTPTEALFIAHKGEWQKTGKDKKDPDGYIFLTDQRLIFEQNEKVGGRMGFGGEQMQEVLFAIPVGAITEAKAEKKGMLGGIDLIHLTLSEGDYAEMTFEVKGGVDCKWFVQQLNRVINGEIDNERAIPVDEAAEEAVQNAPTACTTCGATLPPLVRGQTEMACEYCGTVVRV
ncbi:MAG: hypothetical protein K8S97_09865 [Anaerolineae bacterium]|nr:hypothetical protein [Anaerolineae bacterium]